MFPTAAPRMVPVIEFDPFEYRRDRAAPAEPLATAPAAWAVFWRNSLQDAGICGLSPLDGTWVVPVGEVRGDALLARVLAAHFDADDVPAFLATLPGPFDPASGMNADGEALEEHFTALRGGVALIGAGGARITPECCGDLGNWREWRNATLIEAGGWRDLWIGHPSARVRREDGDVLRMQKVAEDGADVDPPLDVPIPALRAAVDAAVAELMDLDARLHAVLARQGLEDRLARRVARRLAGLAEFDLD